jgi:Predicted dehydrogenases and related proteins
MKIRTAIAGFGLSGKIFQAPFIHADPNFELKKVYERKTERAKEEYPDVQIVRSFEELLTDDIDLVIISTPNDTHVPFAKQAMAAGKHVVVEKPVAATSTEAAELCAFAKKQGVVLSVFQNRRLDSDFLTVKNLIEAGELGEVLDYEAHYDRFERGVNPKPWKAAGGAGVGVLYDLGVHIIDQAYVLFGMPNEVYADFRQQRPESPGIDNFEVILYYDKVKAILSAGEVVARQGPHYMVSGRRGTFIKYGEDVQEAALLAGKRPPAPDWDAEGEECWGTLYYDDGAQILEKKIPTVVSSYARYYENLYEVITAGAPALVPPEQTADVLRIIEAAQMSNAKKRRIAL